MIKPAQVGPGGSVASVAIGQFRVTIACKHAAAAWKPYAPHVLKKRVDTVGYGSKCRVVGSRADSLNAHQDMHEEPGFVLCVVIRATLPRVERKRRNRADIRKFLPYTARYRRHERTISPHRRIYPGEGAVRFAQCTIPLNFSSSAEHAASKPGRVCSIPGSKNGLPG